MIHYGLTIDPGVSNGAVLFRWSDEMPMEIIAKYQFTGGAEGLAAFMYRQGLRVETKSKPDVGIERYVTFGTLRISALVVEKFTPRPNASFGLTLKTVEPLVGEGVLIGAGFKPFIIWREPKQQYFMGDSRLPLPQKKKLAKGFLKEVGMYLTGKDVGQPNADDAISATLHAVSFMRSMKHKPTLAALFDE